MNLPPRQVCKLCQYGDDEVMVMISPDGESWLYTCTAPEPQHPYQWESTIEQYVPGREGICEELGLYDDLTACVLEGEPWVEYGIVEHRYKLLRPDVYAKELLPRYGHRAKEGRRFTLSALLARVLGQLGREGALVGRFGPATGYWHYNGKVSYWARPPAPPNDSSLTWAALAEKTDGLDPEVWELP